MYFSKHHVFLCKNPIFLLIDAMKQVQISGSVCTSSQFDCTGRGGPCVDIAVYHDCVPNCPNGADEGYNLYFNTLKLLEYKN